MRKRLSLFLAASLAAAGVGIATAGPADAIACQAFAGGMVCMEGLKIIVCDATGCGEGVLDMQ